MLEPPPLVEHGQRIFAPLLEPVRPPLLIVNHDVALLAVVAAVDVDAVNVAPQPQRLAAGVKEIQGVTITQPTQANAVFAQVPPAAIPRLQAHTPFYVWNEARSEVRWVCSWDTTETDVAEFIAALKAELN